jgi:hypothetical protein
VLKLPVMLLTPLPPLTIMRNISPPCQVFMLLVPWSTPTTTQQPQGSSLTGTSSSYCATPLLTRSSSRWEFLWHFALRLYVRVFLIYFYIL